MEFLNKVNIVVVTLVLVGLVILNLILTLVTLIMSSKSGGGPLDKKLNVVPDNKQNVLSNVIESLKTKFTPKPKSA